MNVPLQLSGMFPISKAGFQQALVLERAGVFVLFRNGLSEPLFAGWEPHMESGILAAHRSFPNAAHFSFQAVTASESAGVLQQAKTRYGL